MKLTRHTFIVPAAIAMAALASVATSPPGVPEWSLEETSQGPRLSLTAGTAEASAEIGLAIAAPDDIWQRRLVLRGKLKNYHLDQPATVTVTLAGQGVLAERSRQTHVLGSGEYVWLALHIDDRPACQAGTCEERFTLTLSTEDPIADTVELEWSVSAMIGGAGDVQPVGAGVTLAFDGMPSAPSEPSAAVTPAWYVDSTVAAQGVPAPILAVGPEQTGDTMSFVIKPRRGVAYQELWLYGIFHHNEVEGEVLPRLRVRLTPAGSTIVLMEHAFSFAGTGTILFEVPLHVHLACAERPGLCEAPLALSLALDGATERSFALYWGILAEVTDQEGTPGEELIDVEFGE